MVACTPAPALAVTTLPESPIAKPCGDAVSIRLMPVEANEVFVALPEAVITRLRDAGYEFYDWPAPPGVTSPVVRLVAAYDMQVEDADGLLVAARG